MGKHVQAGRGAAALCVLLILSAAAVGCGRKTEPKTGETVRPDYVQTDAEKAKQLMDSETGYVILDVRTEEEYAEGHIPGALLIPDDEIRERAEKELPDKGQLILVYCRSGNRSKTASAALAELGYTNVVEFGGIRSWPYEIEK